MGAPATTSTSSAGAAGVRLPDGTTAAELAEILEATSRRVSARVAVLDRDEKPLGSFVPVAGGSVSVDAGAEVTRAAELVAIDPHRHLAFDAGTPGAGALYADRFVQIDYGLEAPDGSVRYTPIFRGPVIRFERSHPEVQIAAQGKESLGLAPNLPLFRGQAIHLGRFSRIDAAITAIARRMGETTRTIDVPVLRARAGRTISIGGVKEPWRTIVKLANDHGLQAFYDGAGILRVRAPAPRPLWRFDAELLEWPRVTYDLGGEFRNVVRVVGKRPSGRNAKRPDYIAMPKPASDPLSPASLARNGAPRYIAEYLEVEATAQPAVKRKAELELQRRMRQSVAVEFSCLTVPGLEEGDPVAVVLPGEAEAVVFSAQTFGIPLGIEPMSVGYTRAVHVKRRAS